MYYLKMNLFIKKQIKLIFYILKLKFLYSSASQISGIETGADGERRDSNEGESRVASYKVGMLGASGVGKTALTAQFTTSEYICAYDASLGNY